MFNRVSSQAREPDEPKVVKKVQRIEFVDDKQKPIEGVEFLPFGLNTSYFWPEALMGKPKDHQSNSDGVIEVEYPAFLASGKIACESIDGMASHRSHVSQVARINIVENGTARVTMQPGLKLALQGIDEHGTPLSQFTALMSSEQSPKKWDKKADGFIESNAIAVGHYQSMLVHPQANGKTCFSECLVFQFTEADLSKGVVVENIEVLPGIQLHGKLDENVPRPIKNGLVMAYVAPLPIETKGANQPAADFLIWSDAEEIREDGTFTFKSLPQKGSVQVIAMCDGWVGKTMNRTVGEKFSLQEADLDVTLTMSPTMQAIVYVVDDKGKAIAEASVGFSPNMVIWDRFSTILGSQNRTIDHVLSSISPEHNRDPMPRDKSLFASRTDEKGIARIPNLPFNNQSFYVGKKGFQATDFISLEAPAAKEIQPPNFEVFKTVQLNPISNEN